MRYLVPLVLLAALLVPTGLPGISATFAQEPGPGAVRISEFVSDPAEPGNDGAFEWVEIENVSGETVTLTGWSITDEKLADPIPEVTIPAGGFAVIAGKSAEFPPEVTVVRIADGLIGGGLNNGGDTIRLLDASGAVVDEVEYGSGTGITPPGASFSMVRKEDGGWRLAVLPTPGAPNVRPSDAEIEQRFPVPIEFRAGSESTSLVAWSVLAASAAGGAVGGVSLLQRRMKRKSHRAA